MPPHDADRWRELAVKLRREGKLAEAVDACRRALDEAPGDARAWSELAHVLRWQDQLDEARLAAAKAVELAPELAHGWFNLGAVLVEQNETRQGLDAYRRALELNPDFAEAWSNLGGVLGAQGKRSEEIDAYRRAIRINPGLAPVWSNLGNALREQGEIEKAVAACRRALELDPDNAEAWNNLGNALRERGEHEEAIRACETAVRLAPRLAAAWSTLASALHAARRLEEAVRAHRKAIAIRPGDGELHFNLGVTLEHCDRSPEAIACFRRALELVPDHAQAHWDLSFALLRAGQLPEGWEEHEWRWRRPGSPAKRYDFALWDGDASRPRRLLLWAEQGIGDHIIHGGMVADLVTSPMRITLEVDPRLVTLYQRSFPRLAVIPQREPPAADPADYDCQAPLPSLGRWLRRSFEGFPRHRGYLKPDRSRMETYRKRLLENALGATRLIGVSWKSANRELGSYKSHALLDWQEILRAPRARFVDLQYGDTAGERELVEQQSGVRVWHLPELDLYHDIEGLAALTAACDLVITVSNVAAHIAGAQGCPVWLLVPKANGRFWYWFSDRADSPWYPSMRLFSQSTPGDWREALDSVARELAAFAALKL